MFKKFLIVALVFISSFASAGWDEQEDNTIYSVVVNHEEQYSIWPKDREIPRGWKSVGKPCTKQQCLDYIEEVWTDMRPMSLRKQMEAMEAKYNSKAKR